MIDKLISMFTRDSAVIKSSILVFSNEVDLVLSILYEFDEL